MTNLNHRNPPAPASGAGVPNPAPDDPELNPLEAARLGSRALVAQATAYALYNRRYAKGHRDPQTVQGRRTPALRAGACVYRKLTSAARVLDSIAQGETTFTHTKEH